MSVRDDPSPATKIVLHVQKAAPTLEEQLAEARAEIERLERKLRAKDTAIRFWLRHYLALHDGGPCKSCR